MKQTIIAAALALSTQVAAAAQPFQWDSATVYLVMTDRFNNADKANDHAYGRKADAAMLRGFAGGDLAGITAKVKEGYFNKLGVDAIWITPPVEQIHAGTDEGQGKSYGFHGYWALDFTAIDANLGTEAQLRELVDTAHAKGLRVLLDVVMNHTGPVTALDAVWPADWVRTGPRCTYKDARTTMECTLVDNLPDLLTESNASVELPPFLAAKWKAEGRYDREMQELDAFFTRTGYPRAPRYYLMKWHADWVRKYGFDGFRADTVKHTEPVVWKELKQVASAAFEEWKAANPSKKVGDTKFYMTSEVYGYNGAGSREFTFDGGMKVDYYANGFDSMINFALKSDAKAGYEALFSRYAAALKDHSVLNYLSSHDDGGPFDASRTKPFESANKLLLTPGAAQIYYGDETARLLKAPGAEGDANLRSLMNWDELAKNAKRHGYTVGEVFEHWGRLGRFRQAHPAIGAGEHAKLADKPYTFKRSLGADQVVIALDLPHTKSVSIDVGGVFADGATVRDHYSGATAVVKAGHVSLAGGARAVLLAAQ